MKGQQQEVPLYILRAPTEVLLRGPPLHEMVAGTARRLAAEAIFTGRPEDVYSAWVSCSHGSFALWSMNQQLEPIDSTLDWD